jgi:ABC-2 type transport system permease protein
MISLIAKKEFLEIIRDGRFRRTGLVVLLLLTGSILTGWSFFQKTKTERAAVQDSAYEQWLGQGKRNAHSATHYGLYVFKPLLPLSFADKGIDDYAGTAIFLESHKQNEAKLRPAKDSASISRFGELTAAVVLQYFVPLLIILLAFSAISAERESGTLRQVLSLGVSRRQFGIGKSLGLAAVLLILLIPPLILGAIFLVVSENRNVSFDQWQRGVWFVFFYLIYYAILLFFLLAISARFSSRAALVLLLGFWVLTTLIVPRGLADLSKRIYPTPSIIDFSREMEKEILYGENERNERLKQEVLQKYGVSRVEDLPFNFEGLDLQDSEDKGNEIIDRHYEELDEIFDKQNRFQEIFAALSPTQAVRLVSMGLAGTDVAQQKDFARAAEDYRRMMVREMNTAVMENAGEIDANYRGTQGLNRQSSRETWEKVPPFQYAVPKANWVLRNHAPSLAVLFAWLIAACGFAFWSIGGMKTD